MPVASGGKLAREVIELSRPEIGEVREEEGHLRGASSTMPQKANPVGSEAVVGLGILAAQYAGALLTAMQGTHERAAGEWQVEWDALHAYATQGWAAFPKVVPPSFVSCDVFGLVDGRTPFTLTSTLPLACAAAAGAIIGAKHVMAGLGVFPERMRANLRGEGGSIMAEAAMIAVAGVVGRAEAHTLVSAASSAARREGISLRAALEQVLEPEVLAAVGPLDDVLDPAAYLGETDAIVTAALAGWRLAGGS